MTDAESFYLILALFYFVECLKLLPPGTTAIVNPIGQGKHWAPRAELVRLMGIEKWIFLAPLLPWPGLMIVASNQKSNTNDSALRITRRLDSFKKRTASLRVLSLSIFTFFFLILPYLYFLQRGTASLFISIGVGYLMMFTAAFLQFRIRRQLLPNRKMGRVTHTLYTALLPWHAMRCADQLFMDYSRHWSWPAVLAANADSPRARESLLRLWRDSQWGKESVYSNEELKPILEKSGLKLDLPDLSAVEDEAAKYCPCCLAGYGSDSSFCPDCSSAELLNRSD